MAQDPNRLPALDGWRALAVGLVIVHHTGAVLSRSGAEFESSAFWPLSIGVDVFFAISGLLITSRLLDEWDRNGSVNLRSFYIRRAFRILPPANCLLLVTVLLGLSGSAMDGLSCLTFWRNYLPLNAGAWPTTHFWSVSLEEQFYLLWPCGLLLAGRVRAPNILFGSILAVCVWRSVAVLEWKSPGMMFRTDLRVDGLLWGCLAAFLLRRIRIPGWVFALAAVAMVALAGWYRYGGGLIVLPAALAAAVTATAQRPAWTVSRILDWPPFAWIGRMSYSIYLWQQIFLTPAWTSPRLPIDWPIPLRLAAVIIFAAASYYLVEKPCIQIGKRLAAMSPRGALAMAAAKSS